MSIWILKLHRQWFSDLELYVAKRSLPENPMSKMMTHPHPHLMAGRPWEAPWLLSRTIISDSKFKIKTQIVYLQFWNAQMFLGLSKKPFFLDKSNQIIGISVFRSSQVQVHCSLSEEHLIIVPHLTSKIWLLQSIRKLPTAWGSL